MRGLSITVEKQACEIMEIKRLLSSKETTNISAQSPSPGPVTSMASRLAALVVYTPISSSSSLTVVKFSTLASAKFRTLTPGSQKIIDLKACDIKLKERPFTEIQNHIQSSFKANYEKVRDCIISKGMNKDAKNDHLSF